MRVSLGEKIGFAIMFGGMPIAALWGWIGVPVAILGAAVLMISQQINYRQERAKWLR